MYVHTYECASLCWDCAKCKVISLYKYVEISELHFFGDKSFSSQNIYKCMRDKSKHISKSNKSFIWMQHCARVILRNRREHVLYAERRLCALWIYTLLRFFSNQCEQLISYWRRNSCQRQIPSVRGSHLYSTVEFINLVAINVKEIMSMHRN